MGYRYRKRIDVRLEVRATTAPRRVNRRNAFLRHDPKPAWLGVARGRRHRLMVLDAEDLQPGEETSERTSMLKWAVHPLRQADAFLASTTPQFFPGSIGYARLSRANVYSANHGARCRRAWRPARDDHGPDRALQPDRETLQTLVSRENDRCIPRW